MTTGASPLRIVMVAGEASGDLLGANLLAALKARIPALQVGGIGGPKMIAEGCDSWFLQEKLAVRGFLEVLPHYRELSAMRRSLLQRILRERPDVVIGIDAPSFNLWWEKRVKAAGIPVVHYVSPSVWAWRAGRIKKIVDAVGHLLCLFPFEPALFEPLGLPVTYVGHPLADVIPEQISREALRAKLNLPAGVPVITLLPGSRQSEVAFHAATFIETARRLHEKLPGVQFLVPLATRETRLGFETALYQCQAQQLPFRLLFGHAHDALGAADVALVASGTATLEAALMKCPMVITYRVSAASWKLAKRMHLQPWIGLPNVLARRFVVPELLQEEATPDNLAQALLNLHGDRGLREAMVAEFSHLHGVLRQGAADRAAEVVLSMARFGRHAGGARGTKG